MLYSTVLDIEKIKELVKKSFDDEVQTLNIKALTDAEARELINSVNEEKMKDALEAQKKKAKEFFDRVNDKPKGKKKAAKNE